MNIKIKIYAGLLALLIAAYSCNEREAFAPDQEIGTVGGDLGNTTLDNWIKSNLGKPYNIAVKYHWDSNIQNFVVAEGTLPANSRLLPASEKKVPVLLGALKYLWIGTWSLPNTGGEDFIKKYAPREIYMYDGPSFVNVPYKERMNIFNTDGFDPKNPDRVKAMISGAMSAYIKMLIQQKPFDRAAFSRLNLIHQHTADSRENNIFVGEYGGLGRYTIYKGLYTVQSNISIEEDFVGTIIAMLTHSKVEIDEAVEKAGTASSVGSDPVQVFQEAKRAENAKKTLIDKREFVIRYFKENYNLNLGTLQFFSTIRIKKYLSSHEEFTPKP